MLQRKIKVCHVNDLAVGRAVSFHNGIAYNDGGEIKGYVNRCTHMGGPVSLVSGRCLFRCGWHQAEFDPKTGMRMSGQAPEGTALKPIAIEIAGDEVWAVLELQEEFE
ncbi:MAG TPA: Rieske 2Fe-2S domain-containing protein [Candidatus Methylomirabilis sp.]|nr:Rieske 2Fe-2S domain-containing protein [Candidatus Methylomirabilis sp.]